MIYRFIARSNFFIYFYISEERDDEENKIYIEDWISDWSTLILFKHIQISIKKKRTHSEQNQAYIC